MTKKKESNNQDTMPVDRVLVVLEKMQDHIALIAENQSGTNQRLDSIDQRLDSMDQRFDFMDQRFDGVDQRLNSMDQRFDKMDQRFDKLEGEMNEKFDLVISYLMRIEDEILEMKKELETLKKRQLVTEEQAEDFEQRLTTLENGFAKIRASV